MKKVWLLVIVALGLGVNQTVNAQSSQILKQKITVNKITLPPTASVKVSGRVGGYLFNIEGLTSPWAQVQFFSTEGNVNLVTVANKKGEFFFRNALLPLQTGDFCFLSIDIHRQPSPLLCFSPPPPQTRTTLKGIILPPTLSLTKDAFRQGESNAALGTTAPEATIKVYLFEKERASFWELIDVALPAILEKKEALVGKVPLFPALARVGPPLTVLSNQQGEFSFTLPTYKSSLWRVFVGTQKTQLGNNPSPKSNTLQFVALSWWQWLLVKLLVSFIKIFHLARRFLANFYFLSLVLLLSIIYIIYLLKNKRKIIKKN
ncbi:hypothetical protein J7J95_01265 [bacterium]|nr:hypothetical protein [bacterium]